MINCELLKSLAQNEGINLTEDMLSAFDCYAEELVSWNEKINLTAITAPDDIVIKHFLDSLLLLKHIDVKEKTKMIDVGTGAGFPSLPCKIARPDISLTMLDSLNKRIGFLTSVSEKLKLSSECLHGRAEEVGAKPGYRESYDIATARAVAHLRELSEFCLPFVKVGGYFVSLKGPELDAEISEAKAAIKALGGEIEKVITYILPDESNRTIVIIKKISQTLPKYPRSFGKIKKQPIK